MATLQLLCSVWALAGLADPHPLAAPGVTSLTNKSVRFSVPEAHYFEMQRGPVTAIVVDNAAVNVPQLRWHRRGYNGLASLKHKKHPQNIRFAASHVSRIRDVVPDVEEALDSVLAKVAREEHRNRPFLDSPNISRMFRQMIATPEVREALCLGR